MAEREQEHRHNVEETQLNGAIASEKRGVTSGLLCVLIISTAGCFFCFKEAPVQGASVIISVITAIVGTFVYGRRKQTQERIETARIEASQMNLQLEDHPDSTPVANQEGRP